MNERNVKIQSLIASVVAMVSFALRITSIEWIAALMCITFLFSLEMINSSIENFAP